jgi:hypothetical protein
MALLESRIRFRKEIWKALSCTSKKQKLKLVEEWRAKYDEHHVKTLLNCVRNRKAARDILDWKLDEL